MHSRKGKDTVENDKRFEIDTTSQHDEQTREGDESGGQDGRVGEVTELRGRRGHLLICVLKLKVSFAPSLFLLFFFDGPFFVLYRM